MANPWDNDPIVSKAAAGNPWDADPIVSPALPRIADLSKARGEGSAVAQNLGNLVAGLVRGAGSIGATILAPGDVAKDAAAGKSLLTSNRQRRADMDGGLQAMGAQPDSLLYQTGKLGGEIAGTAGTGGLLAKGVTAVAPRLAAAAPKLTEAIASSGFRTGAPAATSLAEKGADLGIRTIGGGIAGGAAAGLVNPEDAATGAVVGTALPGALKTVGATGAAIGKGVNAVGRKIGGEVSPEVIQLAKRAKELGIDIPADRLVNSKLLNAVASGLNYLPFSGRAGTEARMEKQLTKATSRLIGQDSDNMMGALRKAGDDLGGKFDSVLKNNTVKFDKQLFDEVTQAYNTAEKELGSDALKAISSQVDELVSKGASGTIDGQAAYNIKRTLDRIGRRSGPEAFHALELKKSLMGALDRSLGPDAAAEFATTRQQYGNMIALEKIAKNGVEGDISVARLANMPNINNKPLQEIADIAAQFVKAREGQHGAMQRGVAAMGVGSLTGLPGLAATATAGRATNMLLNSGMAKNFVTGNALAQPRGALGTGFNALADLSEPALYRSAPALSTSR